MDWHARYLQQAGWTSELRGYLFQRAGIDKARNVLEVGCGTGAVLKDLNVSAHIHGLDIDPHALKECSENIPQAILTRGDARHLPFLDQSFDLVFCHYFLMWIREPTMAILEMKRVTEDGGSILAFAEPDYSKREAGGGDLQQLGRYQHDALIQQGADPAFGSMLRDRFEECGIRIVEAGMIKHSTPWDRWTTEDWKMEWRVLENDLQGRIMDANMQEYRKLNEKFRLEGHRLFNIPTYFAWGRV